MAGFFELKDITKLNISSARSEPIYAIAFLGTIFSLISISVYLFDEKTLGWLSSKKIKKLEHGFGTKLLNSKINILFGRLESLSNEFEEAMVILPANEFFDDECINDSRSALGAYFNKKFTNQTEQIKELILHELKDAKSLEVEKETNVMQKSYGVGKGVLLKNPMGSNQPVMLVAVTTKRAGEGLSAELSYIFKAVNRIQSVAADNRIDTVFVPVMGSGHGGLKKEVALFGLLLAICNGITKHNGHHIRNFNIVVFQGDDKTPPSVSKIISKRLLRTTTGMFS